MSDMVMELAGVTKEVAEEALARHGEVWLAVDALMAKPVVAGERYIPSKPSVDTGLTLEQKERCDRGRWLQEKVNAVFSVAHSKTLLAPPQAEQSSAPVLKDEPAPSESQAGSS